MFSLEDDLEGGRADVRARDEVEEDEVFALVPAAPDTADEDEVEVGEGRRGGREDLVEGQAEGLQGMRRGRDLFH